MLQSADRGRLLQPPIQIPLDTVEVTISSDGNVSVLQAGQTTQNLIGNITTAYFINPQGLLQQGENLYSATNASGFPLIGQPGLEGRGLLRQGFLESSNVEPVEELVDLIKTQRNFELNSQVVQAADQTLQLTANLRRFLIQLAEIFPEWIRFSRISSGSLIWLSFLFLLQADGVCGVTVRFVSQAKVSGPFILLGDIAEVSGGAPEKLATYQAGQAGPQSAARRACLSWILTPFAIA